MLQFWCGASEGAQIRCTRCDVEVCAFRIRDISSGPNGLTPVVMERVCGGGVAGLFHLLYSGGPATAHTLLIVSNTKICSFHHPSADEGGVGRRLKARTQLKNGSGLIGGWYPPHLARRS